MKETAQPFPLPTIEQIEDYLKRTRLEVLPCYRLAPYPNDPMSLLFLIDQEPDKGDIVFMDTFLLYKILRNLPPFYTAKGDSDIVPVITRFLARHRLVIPNASGISLSVLGEFLLAHFEANPPVPGKANFPTDFDLSQLPDQDKFYGLTRHLCNEPEQD